MLDPTPFPSNQSSPSNQPRSFVLPDDRAIVSLIELILHRSGVGDSEIAMKLGIKPQSLTQYRYGFRCNPGVQWLARLAEVCGARLVIEWPNL